MSLCLVVSGCLKILPPEEIQFLNIPNTKETSGPIKKVVYISENNAFSESITEGAISQRNEVTRFNLFTGNQTFDQKDRSFEVMSLPLYLKGDLG